ncbi:MAG: NAD(P)-binding domain-containing protein [bacterium]
MRFPSRLTAFLNQMIALYRVVVYDIRRGPVKDLVRLGADEARSCKEVAERSDVIVTIVPDSPDVELVAVGRDGVSGGAREEDIYVDMSTNSPTVALTVDKAMERKGVRCLDAPVRGGDVSAQEGTLSIMVGGDEGLFNEMLPILEVMGETIVLCGGNGAGHTVEACNQVQVALNLIGIAEAQSWGLGLG